MPPGYLAASLSRSPRPCWRQGFGLFLPIEAAAVEGQQGNRYLDLSLTSPSHGVALFRSRARLWILEAE
jgi:hypothetical protein